MPMIPTCPDFTGCGDISGPSVSLPPGVAPNFITGYPGEGGTAATGAEMFPVCFRNRMMWIVLLLAAILVVLLFKKEKR